jgi:hypothetical protein
MSAKVDPMVGEFQSVPSVWVDTMIPRMVSWVSA